MTYPIKVKFGRPDFMSLFSSFITQKSQEFHIFSTTSPDLNELLFTTTLLLNKESNVKFHHISEVHS